MQAAWFTAVRVYGDPYGTTRLSLATRLVFRASE